MRSVPWVHGLDTKYGKQGFAAIAVHSPEYEFERDRSRVEKYAQRFRIDHPIYVDNDLAYFKALGATYWPEFYLVDRRGRIRALAKGEMNEEFELSQAMEAMVRTLLAEPAP